MKGIPKAIHQLRFHPLAGKRFEKVSLPGDTDPFLTVVSIPLRGKGLRKRCVRPYQLVRNLRHVSIPLRGKGLRKMAATVLKLSGLKDSFHPLAGKRFEKGGFKALCAEHGLEEFPSPCGEKV